MNSEKPTIFQPTDKPFFWTMLRTEIIQHMLNKTPLWNIYKRNWLFKRLVAEIDGKPFLICSPVHFQQGNNTHIGKNFYCGYNFCCLDHGGVYIGDNVMIAPNVTITTAAHPKISSQRIVRPFPNTFEPYGRGEIEVVKPITIGNNVWIACGAIICQGVTIGDNSIIGAGSVVTKDIPPNVLAMGTPCKVVREITEDDRIQDAVLNGHENDNS